jgi:hypothetical protein
MPDALHWGPFTLPWSLLCWVLAILTGYGLMYWRLRGNLNKAMNNEIITVIGNGLFAFVMVWRFGAVLSNPSLIWTRPLGILLYSGGQQETYYGIIAAGVVVLYSLRKRNISIRLFADLLPWGILGTVAVYQLCKWRYGSVTDVPWGIYKPGNAQFQFHPINVYAAIVALGALLWLGNMKKTVIGTGLIFKQFSIYIGIGLLLVTLFNGAAHGPILTVAQTGLVLLVLLGIFSEKLLTFIDHSFFVHPNQRKERDVMDDKTINSPEQNNKTRENEILDQEQNSVFNHEANEPVDKKLDGPDRPAE